LQIPNIYEGNYKRLIVIPIFFLLVALYFIPQIPQGIDLRGGILITTQTNSTVNVDELKSALESSLNVRDVSVKISPATLGANGIEIEIEQNANLASAEIGLRSFYESYVAYTTADYDVVSYNSSLHSNSTNTTNTQQLQTALAEALGRRTTAQSQMDNYATTILSSVSVFTNTTIPENATPTEVKDALSTSYATAKNIYRDRVLSVLHSNMQFNEFTYKDVSPSLSSFFVQKTAQVVVVSLLLTTLVVVLVFRSFVPSAAVMFGAVNDIIFALGAMGLFGIPMTLASFGALLMLIGFSLDTDMLLTIRVMKRTEGKPSDRAYGAMKTGLLMSVTAIAAFGLMYILSLITQLSTYNQIAAVAICGLIGDVIATWCTNAVIILWNAEKQKS